MGGQRAGSCVKEEVDQGSLSPNSPYGLCGRKSNIEVGRQNWGAV